MISQSASVIYFTDKGKSVCEKIKPYFLKTDIYNKSECTAAEFASNAFKKGNCIIFIGAVGIAVRLISSFIESKDKDPAVIVIDELGKFVIPILSGHIGGANDTAVFLAGKLGAEAVITTATDINKKLSVDSWAADNSCVISDISKIKHISSAILKGEKVGFYSDFALCGSLPDELSGIDKNTGVAISLDEKVKPFDITLNIIPKIIVLGVGCKKNTDSQIFEEFMLKILKENKISVKAVFAAASIDLKADEKCILDFCGKYGIKFVTFTSGELNTAEGVSAESEFVKRVTGVGNVCEASAILLSGKGNIILPKTSENGMTVSIGKKDWKCKF